MGVPPGFGKGEFSVAVMAEALLGRNGCGGGRPGYNKCSILVLMEFVTAFLKHSGTDGLVPSSWYGGDGFSPCNVTTAALLIRSDSVDLDDVNVITPKATEQREVVQVLINDDDNIPVVLAAPD